MNKIKVVQPGEFEAHNHWYPKAFNATIHPMISFFLNLEQERIISRYCHMHPTVNGGKLREVLNHRAKHFLWGGADLLNVTSSGGRRQMVIIENNSCPSGQKSMPLIDDNQEQGSYKLMVERTFKPYLKNLRKKIKGGLAVIYDKNPMEASGYAEVIADVMQEKVYYVDFYKDDPNPKVKKRFLDGTDLNHIMPGKPNGTVSQVYAWRIVNKIIKNFDYLLDLHTASNGRINSYYIRADMSDEIVRKMALLQNAQIIVHNPPNDGTLRGTADELEIPAITLEVGNPNLFQKGMIRDGLTGIHNLLGFLKITDSEVEEQSSETVICKKSYWMYTDTGGLLAVHPDVTQIVKKGEIIATLRNVFGDIIREYEAPEYGIVIGKSVSPVNQAGGRILHLGIIKK